MGSREREIAWTHQQLRSLGPEINVHRIPVDTLDFILEIAEALRIPQEKLVKELGLSRRIDPLRPIKKTQ
jgi:hypothetical protein